MKQFSDLGIKPPSDQMTGEKIKISKILNCDITVTNFKIGDSKFQKNKSGKCLVLQIELKGERRVVFTGSDVLIKMIQQVRTEDMPFTCQIIKEGEHFEFK
jgi:hypothetical protein